MKMRHHFPVLLLPVMLLISACSKDEDPVSPGIENPTIRISGVLDIKPGEVVPDDAKLTVIWSVDAAGDYAYLYGSGSVDTAAGTFTIMLEEPPAPALNSGADEYPSFGVGFIILGDIVNTEPHKLLENDIQKMYGAVSNVGVIYVKGDPAALASHKELNWLAAFASGYDMGEGMKTSGMHDKFVPAAAESFVLTVSSDPSDFTFPNWH